MDMTTAAQLEALKRCGIFKQLAFDKQLEVIIRRGEFTREVYDGLPVNPQSRAASYIAFRKRYEGEEDISELQWTFNRQVALSICCYPWHLLCCMLVGFVPDNVYIRRGAVNPNVHLDVFAHRIIDVLQAHYTQEVTA